MSKKTHTDVSQEGHSPDSADLGPYSFESVQAVIEDWVKKAAANGRIDVKSGDLIQVGIDAERGAEKLRVRMNVGKRDLFQRTPKDLKLAIAKASPRVANAGVTMTAVNYRTPTPALETVDFLCPMMVFAGIAGVLLNRTKPHDFNDYMDEMACCLDGLHADRLGPGGYVQRVKDIIVIAIARHFPTETPVYVKKFLTSLVAAAIAGQKVPASDIHVACDFLQEIASDISALMIKHHAKETKPEQSALLSYYDYYSAVAMDEPYGRFVGKFRVWLHNTVPLYVELNDSEPMPKSAIEESDRNNNTTNWKSKWDQEIKAQKEQMRSLLDQIKAAADGPRKDLIDSMILLDGRLLDDACIDAVSSAIDALEESFDAARLANAPGSQMMN